MNTLPGPIVITGFMGCGKTEVARVLGQRLGLEVIDLDHVITERDGRTPAGIINENGERAFRTVESNALRSVLEQMYAGVISLGGGAWIQEENRELLNNASAITVWIDADFELCWARIEASGEDRPLG
jgi:shikimate kinase